MYQQLECENHRKHEQNPCVSTGSLYQQHIRKSTAKWAVWVCTQTAKFAVDFLVFVAAVNLLKHMGFAIETHITNNGFDHPRTRDLLRCLAILIKSQQHIPIYFDIFLICST